MRFWPSWELPASTSPRLIRMPAPGVPETTAALLRLAASYESTQPSYAADLRAAAAMQERGDGPRR